MADVIKMRVMSIVEDRPVSLVSQARDVIEMTIVFIVSACSIHV
jgi:hypothetical protein